MIRSPVMVNASCKQESPPEETAMKETHSQNPVSYRTTTGQLWFCTHRSTN